MGTVRIGWPIKGVDWVVNAGGQAAPCNFETTLLNWLVIRKIEKPAKYRPFKNAAEFEPHRDRWWYHDNNGVRRHFPPASYSDKFHGASLWQRRFETCFFDDGTPFGVKIDE